MTERQLDFLDILFARNHQLCDALERWQDAYDKTIDESQKKYNGIKVSGITTTHTI